MQTQIVSLICSLGVSLLILARALRDLESHQVKTFILNLLAVALLIGSRMGSIISLAARDTSTYFWLDLTFVSTNLIAISFLFFISALANGSWITRKMLWFFSLPSIVACILMFTGHSRELYYSIEFSAEKATVIYLAGFWLAASYCILILLFGAIGLLRVLMDETVLFYSSIKILIVGAPWVAGLMTDTWLSDYKVAQVTPLLLFVASIVLIYLLLEKNDASLLPISHGILFESLSDGLLVLDQKRRILNMNSAAEVMLNISLGKLRGIDIAQIYPELGRLIYLQDPTPGQAKINNDNVLQSFGQYIHVEVKRIVTPSRLVHGSLVRLSNVTNFILREKNLQETNQTLFRFVDQNIDSTGVGMHEIAYRDYLTNIFNRRYLDENIPHLLSASELEKQPFCILIFDIDRFKGINDFYGHKIGDLVLKAVTECVQSNTRSQDLFCRYGGDEFVLAMAGTSIDVACARAEKIAADVRQVTVAYKDLDVKVSLSIGIASFPDQARTMDRLLRLADKALYRAKAAGRNCVRVFDPSIDSDSDKKHFVLARPRVDV